VIVMIANNSGREAHRLKDTFPGRVGHIYSPAGLRATPWPIYGLDNGAFPCWTKGLPFDGVAFTGMLEAVAGINPAPRWVAVPDVVTDREATIASWHLWEPKVGAVGFPLAFVVQDGMTPSDVPPCDVVFVGGSTEWKWSSVATWCKSFPRVHVGRVNSERLLWLAHDAGAESCDGTGWFRGDRKQLDGLWYYLADSSGVTDSEQGPMQYRLGMSTTEKSDD